MTCAKGSRETSIGGVMGAALVCGLLAPVMLGSDCPSANIAACLEAGTGSETFHVLWILAVGSLNWATAQATILSTDEAAYAVDQNGVIVAWNPAATRLFGYTASEAVGRKCWELLAGEDVFCNRYCCSGCPVREAAFGHTPVKDSRLLLRSASGVRVQVDVCLLLVSDGEDAHMLAHLCRPLPKEGDVGRSDRATDVPAPLNRERGALTSREIEILGLLARGDGTRQIASRLCLSPATVRNHVQHILFKLRVHSRIAAVVKAQQLGLI